MTGQQQAGPRGRRERTSLWRRDLDPIEPTPQFVVRPRTSERASDIQELTIWKREQQNVVRPDMRDRTSRCRWPKVKDRSIQAASSIGLGHSVDHEPINRGSGTEVSSWPDRPFAALPRYVRNRGQTGLSADRLMGLFLTHRRTCRSDWRCNGWVRSDPPTAQTCSKCPKCSR